MTLTPPKPFELTDRDIERFRRWVAPPNANGCELWLGQLSTRGGYGQFRICPKGQPRRFLKAHLVSLYIDGPPWPADLYPDHLCEVHHCVSVKHLEWVTQAENNRRISLRMTVCRKGLHPWVPENWSIDSKRKTCLECRRESKRKSDGEYRVRNRATIRVKGQEYMRNRRASSKGNVTT